MIITVCLFTERCLDVCGFIGRFRQSSGISILYKRKKNHSFFFFSDFLFVPVAASQMCVYSWSASCTGTVPLYFGHSAALIWWHITDLNYKYFSTFLSYSETTNLNWLCFNLLVSDSGDQLKSLFLHWNSRKVRRIWITMRKLTEPIWGRG